MKDQLDPKYKFLADAPQRDDVGNKAVVRFLRKTKEQYVMSEFEGKATGWRAYFRDGRWVEERPAAKAPRRKAGAKATKKKGARKAAKGKSAAKKKAARAGAKRKASGKKKKKAPTRKASERQQEPGDRKRAASGR